MHNLTPEEAARANALTGFARDPGETEEDNPGNVEGDQFETFALPNGQAVAIVGVREDGAVVGVLVDKDPDTEEYDVTDETPVGDEVPTGNPSEMTDEEWNALSDSEKRTLALGSQERHPVPPPSA